MTNFAVFLCNSILHFPLCSLIEKSMKFDRHQYFTKAKEKITCNYLLLSLW